MKSNTSKLSVGLVGFLAHKMDESSGPTHALVGCAENPENSDHKPDHKPDQNPAERLAPAAPVEPCATCHGRRLWRGADLWVCATCHPPVTDPAERCELPADARAAWTRDTEPDSRRPLIPPEVRAKIEAVEADARAMGWPPELLWNAGFWDSPRGLAALLDPEDEIGEVTADYIEVLKCRRDLQRFRRCAT
jgi:hypothetical protein